MTHTNLARILVVTVALVAVGACGGSSDDESAAPAPTNEAASATTLASGEVQIPGQGHGTVLKRYGTIAEMTADVELVVRATATSTSRNATIFTRDTKLTTFEVTDVLKGDRSLVGQKIELEQNRVPLHEDFPFPKPGTSYVLFVIGGRAPEEGGIKTTYGPFGMFETTTAGVLTDLDPESGLTPRERSLSLAALRSAVQVTG